MFRDSSLTLSDVLGPTSGIVSLCGPALAVANATGAYFVKRKDHGAVSSGARRRGGWAVVGGKKNPGRLPIANGPRGGLAGFGMAFARSGINISATPTRAAAPARRSMR